MRDAIDHGRGLCSEAECDRYAWARGLCQLHYGRLRRTGTTKARTMPTLGERFWSKVAVGGQDECWIWLAAQDGHGYGQMNVDGQPRKAYRISWELAGNAVPEGLALDHHCFERLCVNPAHLRVVTGKQNAEHVRGPARHNRHSGKRNVYRAGSVSEAWSVRIRHNGKILNFGTYPTIAEADAVARMMRAELYTHDDYEEWSKKRQETTTCTAVT